MCGRYASTQSTAALAAVYQAEDDLAEAPIVPSYNVAPTDPVHIVRRVRQQRVVSTARWGLLPPWAAEARMGARMINARAETVATSRAYRGPFARRRCLVPADGWYEWLRLADGGPKQPFYLTPHDGAGLAFAGLWEVWTPPARAGSGASGAAGSAAAGPVLTCTILTTAAIGELRQVHDRMPLVLSSGRWSSWLGEEQPDIPGGAADVVSQQADLLASEGEGWAAGIELRPVGREVGDVRNDSPSLIQSVIFPPRAVDDEVPIDLTLF
ncbi:MAG: SOS response-associated peptidase [Micromonosporaceae bacterium]